MCSERFVKLQDYCDRIESKLWLRAEARSAQKRTEHFDWIVRYQIKTSPRVDRGRRRHTNSWALGRQSAKRVVEWPSTSSSRCALNFVVSLRKLNAQIFLLSVQNADS